MGVVLTKLLSVFFPHLLASLTAGERVRARLVQGDT